MTQVDVCIYGGTSAAVMAALAVAGQGRSVRLINPSRHLGGMSSGGLGATDMGNIAVIGGLAREFYRRVGQAYGVEEQWRFEPHVAEQVFNAWVQAAGIPILSNQRVSEVTKQGTTLTALTTQAGDTVAARVFIDASYEGDLMARAGVPYTWGRESVAHYGESLNGIRAQTPSHQFLAPVDPYVQAGNPKSGLLPGIQVDHGKTPGEGDHCLQAYNFRLCLTRDPNNRLTIPPPPAYDPGHYEVLARYLAALLRAGREIKFSELFLIIRMPNGKTDFNNSGAFSTDHLGANWDYPEASAEGRAKIWQAHSDYTRGLFHFLASEPRVPEWIRKEAQAWGLCRDEFPESGGWPPQLYLREVRRMLGPYVITQADCEGQRPVTDSIGMGSYTLDSHNCRRIVQQGLVQNEGDVQVSVSPYPISYRAVLPPPAACGNLLVPVCLSASHIAYGSIRMEPVFMVLGQSAGVAACQALDEARAVQEIDVGRLQRNLRELGQVLDYSPEATPAPTEWPHAAFAYQEGL